MRPSPFVLLPALAFLPAASPAAAVDVRLNGLVLNSCILSLSTPGTLALSPDGKTLTSDQAGGVAATMNVVATGSLPTVTFGAPVLSAPAGWQGSPVTTVSMKSVNMPLHDFTSGATTVAMSALLDLFTVHGRVRSESGFASGAYSITTVATCQQ